MMRIRGNVWFEVSITGVDEYRKECLFGVLCSTMRVTGNVRLEVSKRGGHEYHKKCSFCYVIFAYECEWQRSVRSDLKRRLGYLFM